MVFGGGSNSGGDGVFAVHGHHWQAQPWTQGSTVIGNNPQSENYGAEQVVPNQVSNFVIDKAGGAGQVQGDYLYEMVQGNAEQGMWGLLRVQDVSVVITSATTTTGVAGTVSVNQGASFPATVQVTMVVQGVSSSCNAAVNATTGAWSTQGPPSCNITFQKGAQVTASVAQGAKFAAKVR